MIFFFDPGIILKWVSSFPRVLVFSAALKNDFIATSMTVFPSARGYHAEELAFPWGVVGAAFLCCLLY